jgi:hypothetical protein
MITWVWIAFGLVLGIVLSFLTGNFVWTGVGLALGIATSLIERRA